MALDDAMDVIMVLGVDRPGSVFCRDSQRFEIIQARVNCLFLFPDNQTRHVRGAVGTYLGLLPSLLRLCCPPEARLWAGRWHVARRRPKCSMALGGAQGVSLGERLEVQVGHLFRQADAQYFPKCPLAIPRSEPLGKAVVCQDHLSSFGSSTPIAASEPHIFQERKGSGGCTQGVCDIPTGVPPRLVSQSFGSQIIGADPLGGTRGYRRSTTRSGYKGPASEHSIRRNFVHRGLQIPGRVGAIVRPYFGQFRGGDCSVATKLVGPI